MKSYLFNMLVNIKNGQLAKRAFVYHPRKKNCELLLQLLWNEGFIFGYQISFEDPKTLKIFLKYQNTKSIIQTIKPISTFGYKIYYSSTQISQLNSSKSFIILSTNKGFKSLLDCKRSKIGGKPISVIN